MSSTGASERASPGFTTTHWSVVLMAGRSDPVGAAALEQLCRVYWYPTYAFVRRRGTDWPEAQDLTQGFFAHLFEHETLRKVDQQKGKFRTFLLTALTNFLANEWDRRRALKRGGRCRIISLEASAEERYRREPVEPRTPEQLFARRWAITLVEQVLARLEQEYAAAGKADVFATLEPGLTNEVVPGGYAAGAARLGVSEGAARVALHRLRRRFGELLRGEIARTVASPAEVDEEIRQLFAAIAI